MTKGEGSGGTKIVLFESELEKEAARVAGAVIGRTAGGVMDTVGDVFGGFVGDAIREWRTRNLIGRLARTAEILKARGVHLDKARVLPMGEAYAMFEEASKQDDPAIAEMWSALLANAMDQQKEVRIDPAFVEVLRVIGSTEAYVLRLIYDFKNARTEIMRQVSPPDPWQRHTSGMCEEAQRLLKEHAELMTTKLSQVHSAKQIEIALSSLLRERCLYIPAPLYRDRDLINRERTEFGYIELVDPAKLEDALGDFSWAIDGQGGRAEDRQPLAFTDSIPTDLSYDITDFGYRLLRACEPGPR